MSFPCLTDEAKGSFDETFHLKTVVRTGVLGINYWIEVRMENEEEHTGRQMEANTQSGSLKHYLITIMMLNVRVKCLNMSAECKDTPPIPKATDTLWKYFRYTGQDNFGSSALTHLLSGKAESM